MPDITITIPAGPVVVFDPDAMRAWLTSPAGLELTSFVGSGLSTPADDAEIDADNLYQPETANPGDWLDYLLLRISQDRLAPAAWRTPPGVAVEAHHTADFGGDGDGGAVLVVSFGGAARFTTGKLEMKDLVSGNDPAKTELDAAVEAFGAAADAINTMFETLTG